MTTLLGRAPGWFGTSFSPENVGKQVARGRAYDQIEGAGLLVRCEPSVRMVAVTLGSPYSEDDLRGSLRLRDLPTDGG